MFLDISHYRVGTCSCVVYCQLAKFTKSQYPKTRYSNLIHKLLRVCVGRTQAEASSSGPPSLPP